MIYILKRDNEEALEESNIINEVVTEERYFKQVVLSGLTIIMVLCIISVIMSCTISSSLESTAPVTIETSISETEETIHTDTPITAPTTPATSRATVTPTKNPTKPTSTPATQSSTSATVNSDELELLACVIYQEAGGNASCDDCRRYVADTVLNRVAHEGFPDTIYDVLTAKDQ